mmetsp:Transcript_3253/g.5332  ORF Transcript_3253/g.5332 Transcript_3253/m.5332 type:complete len:82 (+) Transcript_3253:111-356(+)
MWAIQSIAVLFLGASLHGAAGHGYVSMPPLRGGVAGTDKNGYCPQCGNGPTVCGDGGQWPEGSDYLNYGPDTDELASGECV